jgi:hypothetical protein
MRQFPHFTEALDTVPSTQDAEARQAGFRL